MTKALVPETEAVDPETEAKAARQLLGIGYSIPINIPVPHNATIIENVAVSTDYADKTEIYMDQLEQTENLVASTPLKC